MTFIEGSVTVKEIATLNKRTTVEVEDECRELGLFIGTDWAGRPAVSESDAHQIVSGEARRTREDARAWSSHLRSCEAWVAGRDEAVRGAASAHTAASAAQGRFDPDADSRARAAGVAAGREFEESTPPPLWNGVEDGNARRMFSEAGDRPGLLGRALDVLAGAPR